MASPKGGAASRGGRSGHRGLRDIRRLRMERVNFLADGDFAEICRAQEAVNVGAALGQRQQNAAIEDRRLVVEPDAAAADRQAARKNARCIGRGGVEEGVLAAIRERLTLESWPCGIAELVADIGEARGLEMGV